LAAVDVVVEDDVDDVVVDEDGTVVVVVLVVVVVVAGEPLDTTMLTELPGRTDAPGPGLDEVTVPAWYWEDGSGVTPPRVRPSWLRRLLACDWLWPMSEGTVTLA
jgi:hypothetical protein